MTAVAARADEQLYDALRAGDERAFTDLVERYHGSLVRLATTYVKNRAVAEEVAQDTWLAVIRGLDRFESRSLLKTWIFRILTNKAKTRARRESRSRPFSSLESAEAGKGGPSVEPERFLDASHPVWPGHWASPPRSWDDVPEARLVSRETRSLIDAAIAALPDLQARVITMRDVAGWSSEEVCEALGISDANQRVLLHRARSKVRAALERYLDH
jgi:RNA polymerase sigma-70 factor (ECF subfamily)